MKVNELIKELRALSDEELEAKIKETKKELEIFKVLKDQKISLPKWLEFSGAKLSGKILELPTREDIDLNIQENLIIELYSK